MHEGVDAGVVQAFAIAVHAEMYGFPLTIYFLADGHSRIS
jgi:hypothetical protein